MVFCRESSLNVSQFHLAFPNGAIRLVEIDPGEAYGRGGQPSTNLCIEALERIFRNREIDNVLDVGSGTGVLAICAIALGANYATAIDVDPVAVQETRINVK